MERLQKILSAAGLCSRRQAESYILGGRVTVNGTVAQLGDRADAENDSILIDGKPLCSAPKKLYLMLNKPRGYVTTLSDERGRRTVVELVSDCGERVYPVGRLDMDSDGLLLLTTDGDFAQRMAHPSHQKEKEYHVTVSGDLKGCAERLAELTQLEDGTPIVPAQVKILRKAAVEWTLSVTIYQGLNRQIRRMCALCGLKVLRLQRVREGALTLGNLALGKWRTLTVQELALLKGK
ncbi:MAG: rRNA pseudouridine synthase [Oscillospiraceae bacterium]|nr:rRNA pseudouridine synthase [Oscillospiraceae bacterium]